MSFRHTFLWAVLVSAGVGCDGGFSHEIQITGSTLRYSWSGGGVHLAYTIERDLFVTNADWSVCTRLDGAATGRFAWSPDGTRLAYVTRDPATGLYALVTIRADGSERRTVTGGWGAISALLWSPDSARIAFRAGFAGLHTVRADGSGGAALIAADTLLLDFAWSPDGARVAYRAGTDLFVAFADGSGRQVVASAVRSGGPVWCLGGTRLLYRGDALYSVRPDGTDRRRMSGDLEVVGGFACSPDGAFIAFATVDGDLYVTDWEGGDPYLVAGDVAFFVTLPVFEWSPDGSWLAFRDTFDRLFTFDPAARVLVEIDEDVDPGFAWSPDGAHLAYRSAGWLYAAAASGGPGVAFGASEAEFTWSPDGGAVLFVLDGLFTGRILDGFVERVSDLDIIGEPAWLLAGDRIVFRALGPGGAVGLYFGWPHGGVVRFACADSQ